MDSNYSTAYVYGQDGQRSNKYTQSSETLYFNKMWTLHTDSGNNVYGGQTAKNIYLGETRIVTKLNSGNNPTYQEEYYKQYFYHSDHLGSASLISDYKGDEYQRIEYTPYGETWVEKTSNTGLEFLPYKFTAKELDKETGLYYYGARYLDSKYSRWISTDPALGEYMRGSSAGEGGIYNSINFNLYHYAANNPIRYTDPTGMWVTNEDGTYRAEAGDTLYDLYGEDWQSKSGFDRDPRTLQVGEIVGKRKDITTPLASISIPDTKADSPQKKSFLSNHSSFVSYNSNDEADAFYAGVGANFDIKNGNFNLNAKAGIANYDGSWSVLKGSHNFNFGLSGRVSGISADGVVGLEGSILGASGGVQVFKGGGTVDVTLFGLKVSLGGDIMAGGIGAGLQLGKKGFKANLDIGFGVGVQLTWEFVK